MRKIFLFACLWTALALHAQQRIEADAATLARFKGARPAAMTTEKPRRNAEGLSSIQRAVGYVAGGDPDSITLKGVMIGQAGTYPVATLITADMLSTYMGCRVVGIRVAAARSLGKSDIFLHPVSPDGTIDDEQGITKSQRLYEGWNNVFFNGDMGWDISEGESLLVGFDYKETEEMVQEQSGGLCTVGESQGNDFLIYSDYGQGLAWYSIGNVGSLCVQLIVDVSNLPEKDLSLLYLDTGFRYKRAGEVIEMYTIAGNTGRTDIDAYTLTCQVDDNEPVVFRYNGRVAEQATDHRQPAVQLPADIAVGRHSLRVTVLPGDETEAGAKATQTVAFFVYDQTMERQKNMVEQYNSQRESMAAIVNPYFNSVAETNEAVALVNVYAPGCPLALPETDYLFDLYAYTVPSFTINRSYFPGEDHIAYDVNYYAELYGALVPSIIDDMMRQDLLMPAFANIQLAPAYNPETRELTVDVSGDMVEKALDIFDNLSVTLLLTENDVVSEQVAQNPFAPGTSTQKNYLHQHVLRTYITPALGSPVQVSGNTYTAHFSTTLPAEWDVEKMTLVGYLARGIEQVDPNEVKQMDITNCNSVPLAGLAGMRMVDAQPQNQPAEYYTLNGQRADSRHLQPGIYIVRQGNQSRKVVVR